MKMTVEEIAKLAGCSKSIVNARIRRIMPEASAGRGGKTMLDEYQADALMKTLPITNRDLILEIREANKPNEVRSSGSSDLGPIVQAIDKMQSRQEDFMLKMVEMLKPDQTKPEIEAPATVPQLLAPAPEISSRDRINKIVRGYCQEKRIPFKDGFNRIYLKHKYACNKDLKLKAKNRDIKTLDMFELEGEIQNLLAIAIKIYGE